MQVSVKETSAIERRLTVSVPHAEVGKEIEKRLREKAKRARISGFRPGKAPQNIIDQHYGAEVTNAVVSDTINSSYHEALDKKKIVPAGLVSIEPKPFVAGSDLQYVAVVELFPKIPSPSLAGRKIQKPVCKVAAEDIDRTLEDIRNRNAEFTPKKEKSEKGDRLTVDFVGTIDGKPFAGGEAKDHPFILGNGQMLESFERDLFAVKAGETKKISFKFPKEYGSPELAGKEAKFEVTVKSVDQPVLPELNDALAEKLGIKEGGLNKMREEIKANLERELAARTHTTMRERVLEELLAVNKIDPPNSLVEAEIDRRVEAVTKQLAEQTGQAADAAASKIDRTRFAKEAKNQVILGLIIRDIIEKSKITVDDAAVRAKIEEMAATYDDSETVVKWYYAEDSRRQPVEGVVLEEQVIARMLETATVTEKKVSFKEYMNLDGKS